MSGQVAINPLLFATEAGRLQGEIPTASMERLRDVLTDTSGAVHYVVEGSRDARQRAVLDVSVDVTLTLTCQRCLGPMPYDLRRMTRFIVARSEDVLPDVADEDPETETMPARALADIGDVVEQEVLLGLPIAPSHPEGVCVETGQRSSGDRHSPFAVLEQLKRPL